MAGGDIANLAFFLHYPATVLEVYYYYYYYFFQVPLIFFHVWLTLVDRLQQNAAKPSYPAESLRSFASRHFLHCNMNRV